MMLLAYTNIFLVSIELWKHTEKFKRNEKLRSKCEQEVQVLQSNFEFDSSVECVVL